MTSSRRASLLVVLAHPDDEIFHGGILAHLSGRGVRVTLACATNGEAGKAHPSVGAVDDLGALRAEELKLSCHRLGIDSPVLLGFHDSARGARQRHGDVRALANVDMIEVETAIRKVIDDVKPHVILTFDPHGGYYHPDHLAVQRATTAAFFSSGVMGVLSPERLFYGTMLRDVFRRLAEESRGRGITDDLDPDIFGTATEMIAVSFDASSLVRRKFLALAAHRSAFGVTEEMLTSASPDRPAVLNALGPVFEREVFVLGGTRIPVSPWPLSDFFEGMTSAALKPAISSAAALVPDAEGARV
jgi:N-acetyl-1-D-myo-inositol-2-amino-2-deoxy-alpha-D-glucopyranoside deacetylase